MAEFRYYLNRQGARGPQGPQGEKGFSPDISVEKDTLSEYILRITNEGGYFLTTNLREHKEDRGGTYIRYDRATGVMYAGDAELATTDTLGVIRIAGDDDFAGKAEDAAVTPAQVQDYVTGEIDVVNQKVNTLDEATVKLDGVQTITGAKTFSSKTIFNDNVDLKYNLKLSTGYGLVDDVGTPFLAYNQERLSFGFGSKPLILQGTSITDNNNKKFLVQGSITAGSDNLVITETGTGVQLTVNAPTNAQIEALQRLINDLSTKVDNLTTRLNNLEEVIDGGIA